MNRGRPDCIDPMQNDEGLAHCPNCGLFLLEFNEFSEPECLACGFTAKWEKQND